MSNTHIQDKCYLVDYFKIIILLSISSMRWYTFISGVMVRFYVYLNRGLCYQVYVSCVLSHSVMSDSFAASWTVAHQAPLFMGSFRREFWSKLHFLLRGIFPTRGSSLSPPSPALPMSLCFWTIREDQMYTFVKTPPLELGPFVFPDLRLCLAVACLCVCGGKGGAGAGNSVQSCLTLRPHGL